MHRIKYVIKYLNKIKNELKIKYNIFIIKIKIRIDIVSHILLYNLISLRKNNKLLHRN